MEVGNERLGVKKILTNNNNKKVVLARGWAWWHMPLIPAPLTSRTAREILFQKTVGEREDCGNN